MVVLNSLIYTQIWGDFFHFNATNDRIWLVKNQIWVGFGFPHNSTVFCFNKRSTCFTIFSKIFWGIEKLRLQSMFDYQSTYILCQRYLSWSLFMTSNSVLCIYYIKKKEKTQHCKINSTTTAQLRVYKLCTQYWRHD